jgi:hypothetical protein
MKKFFIALNVFLIVVHLTFIGCDASSNKSQNNASRKIFKIKITDRTDVHYYMNGRTIGDTIVTDPAKIAAFQVELDSMKEVQNMNTEYNLGFYEIILYYTNGTKEDTGLIYTVYDGVVFYNENTAKAFKNNHMEEFVRAYFMHNQYK